MKFLQYFFAIFIISLFTVVPIAAREQINCLSSFTDVTPDTPTCFYTNYLDYQRVISGYDDLTFRESENLTRGQMSKFIVNAFQIPVVSIEEDEQFPDVDEDHTFYSYIHSLKDQGLVNGYSDGNFKPDEPVSRGQILKFLANAVEYKDPEALLDKKVRGKNFFTDIDSNNKFYDYLLKLYVATESEEDFDRIIEPSSDQLYRPEDPLKRGEMAAMVTNAMFYTDVRNKISLPQYSKLLEGIEASDEFYEGTYEINHYNDYGLTVLSTQEPYEYVYEALNPRSVNEIALDKGFDFAVNAGYFGAGYNEAGYSTEHAGLLQVLGIQYTPIKTDQDSTQLTHMVVYNQKTNNISFTHRADYEDITSDNYIIFQSGPSVIMGNRAEKHNINNSKNGRVQRPRVLMGMTSGKDKHFFIFRYNYSLNEIADIMLHLDYFEGKDLSVINLDGGSSIAFYAKDIPQLNYGIDKHLPNLIGL